MRKTIILFATIIFATIFGCSENEKIITDNEFVLNGELEGIDNESWIYLILDSQIIDSTKITNNRFILKGTIEHPKKHGILVKGSQNHSSIWLESGKINFKAKNGKFKDAIIVGSNSQKENEKLWKPIWEYRKRRDSLSQIVYNEKLNDSLKLNAKLEFKKLNQNWLNIETKFIKNNPNSYVSANTLDFYATSLSKKTVSELYNAFHEGLKNSTYGKSIKRFLELNKNPKVGDKYVDFSMTNENGELIKLSDFEGNLVLLDFWSSLCGPCIQEYPALKKAYSQFSKEGFEIISISEDLIKEEWLKAIEKNDLNWVNLWQDGGKADPHLIYGIKGIPDNFLINKEGIIVARNLRGENLISEIKKEFGRLNQ